MSPLFRSNLVKFVAVTSMRFKLSHSVECNLHNKMAFDAVRKDKTILSTLKRKHMLHYLLYRLVIPTSIMRGLIETHKNKQLFSVSFLNIELY